MLNKKKCSILNAVAVIEKSARPATLIMFILIQFTSTVLQAESDPGVSHIRRYLAAALVYIQCKYTTANTAQHIRVILGFML